MIEKFSNTFIITAKKSTFEDKEFYKDLSIELFNMLDLFGGYTFANGLYRMHSFKSSVQWSLIITEYFASYRNKIYPFGFDWMGRQFCLSTANDCIFMFDPATAEDFELRQTLTLLHNEDFVNNSDDMLSIELFNKVLELHKIKSIDYNECLGYKTPLFLGGKDEIENYELQDMEVYWSIESQIYQQIKDLPEGSKIGNIKIQK